MIFKRKNLIVLFLSVSLLATAAASNAKNNKSNQNEEITIGSQESFISSNVSSSNKNISVHFIDVDQGDSILIMAGSSNILIDGGERGATVLNYLKAKKITKLDLVVGTHPHSDHIGGLINVLQDIFVKEVLDPGVVHTTKTFEDYLTIIDEKNIKFTTAKEGQSYTFEDKIILKVLHPYKPSLDNVNDSSIVIQLIYDDIKFMFTGDAEKYSENEILSRKENIKSNILKVGHHGSNTSSTKAFLNAVKPEVAIIMAGNDNKYGHPHKETMGKLNSAGIKTYVTKKHGTIIIETNGKTYSVKAQKTKG